ncbi:MAG TPA: response regulator [Oxalobacteraceae bacterium]|nr:response regulator [Oxalobacteraceae bacterium]
MNQSLAPAPSSSAPRTLRIFLVEDSPAVRDLLIQNLTNIPGVELAGVAEDENDALEKLLRHACDVLILDIRLKQGNGMSLLRTLAKLPDTEISVKIIFTNNASDTYRRASAQYGVGFFFDKSTDFLQLRSLMQELAVAAPMV